MINHQSAPYLLKIITYITENLHVIYPNLRQFMISAINLHVRPLTMKFIVILGKYKKIKLMSLFLIITQTSVNQTDASQHFKHNLYLWRTILDLIPGILPASTYLGLRKNLDFFGIPSVTFEMKYLWTFSGYCLAGSCAVLVRLPKLNILWGLSVVFWNSMLPSNNA